MQVKILTKEETAKRASELLSLPFFRPSHRLVNIFDKKNNTVYITEFQDYMGARKEDFNLSCNRSLAIETDPSDLVQFLPEDVQDAKDLMAFTAGELYFVIANGRYFVVGNSRYNNYIRETRTDGFELLGEVTVDSAFRPVWLPRLGFAIRSLGMMDRRHTDQYFSPSFEPDEPRRRDYSGIFILVNSKGEQIFEDCGADPEQHDQLRAVLDVPREVSADTSWRLRLWAYPNEWEIDGENNYRSRRYDRKKPIRRLLGHGAYTVVNIEPGSGKVELLGRDGVMKEDTCVPWTEYSYVETFYA